MVGCTTTVILLPLARLLKNCSALTWSLQKVLLNKVAAITVSGPEFKEIVLSKYGRNLDPKIKNTYFDPNVMSLAKGNVKVAANNVRERYCISSHLTVVCLGHSGYENGQRLELLESLASMDQAKKDKLFVVIPMT